MAQDEDNELPAWADILAKGPLKIDKLTPAELQAEYETRLLALLDSYGAENTFDGWRDVAINLAIRLHPAFKVQKRRMLPVSGRPKSDNRWFWRQAPCNFEGRDFITHLFKDRQRVANLLSEGVEFSH